jgi:hypothetical protein
MRKWCVLAALILLLAFPAATSAQEGIVLSSLNVQLLPEYDQASMLVIYDFQLASSATLPVDVVMQIPADANLFAVAYSESGNLINANYLGPQVEGDWQTFTIQIDRQTVYRVEYYQPLAKADAKRQFSYLWPGSYAVDNFSIFLGKPADLIRMVTQPDMDEAEGPQGSAGFGKDFGSLAAGEQFTLDIQYEKSSDTLVLPPQELQPASPVDENTPGRISLGNYVPYILGGAGLALILGGLVYYWRAGRKPGRRPRQRNRAHAEREQEGNEMYCHQCGARAKPGDRFCRVCGARLRQDG